MGKIMKKLIVLLSAYSGFACGMNNIPADQLAEIQAWINQPQQGNGNAGHLPADHERHVVGAIHVAHPQQPWQPPVRGNAGFLPGHQGSRS